MADGYADLDEMIARMRGLRTIAVDAAKLAAPSVLRAAQSTAKSGTDPYGKAWPQKKSGGRALVNAANAITVETAGPTLSVVLSGVEVFHNSGVDDGAPKRQIIPDRGQPIPSGIAAAIVDGAREAFNRATGTR